MYCLDLIHVVVGRLTGSLLGTELHALGVGVLLLSLGVRLERVVAIAGRRAVNGHVRGAVHLAANSLEGLDVQRDAALGALEAPLVEHSIESLAVLKKIAVSFFFFHFFFLARAS
jgi:hypothetical protein